MTVKQLIEKLKTLPENALVIKDKGSRFEKIDRVAEGFYNQLEQEFAAEHFHGIEDCGKYVECVCFF